MCGNRVFGEVLVNSIAKSFEMLVSLLLPLLGIFMPGFSAEVPCLDPLACYFREEGECFFNDENGNPCVIEGVPSKGACNYDPEADIYDGSCEFESLQAAPIPRHVIMMRQRCTMMLRASITWIVMAPVAVIG